MSSPSSCFFLLKRFKYFVFFYNWGPTCHLENGVAVVLENSEADLEEDTDSVHHEAIDDSARVNKRHRGDILGQEPWEKRDRKLQVGVGEILAQAGHLLVDQSLKHFLVHNRANHVGAVVAW